MAQLDAAAPPDVTAQPDASAQPDATGPGSAGLAAQIADMDRRIARLGVYIDALQGELDVGDLVRLNDLHSKMMGRVTRMRQAQQHLDSAGGDEQSVLKEATDWALNELNTEPRNKP